MTSWAATEPEREPLPVTPHFIPAPPRPFGEPRVYRLDGGFRVTVEGAADSLEPEIWIRQEGDELHIFAGDAALRERMARQLSSSAPSTQHSALSTQHSATQHSVQTSAPADVDPRSRYPEERIQQSRRDAQDAALADVGMDMRSLAASYAPDALGDEFDLGGAPV